MILQGGVPPTGSPAIEDEDAIGLRRLGGGEFDTLETELLAGVQGHRGLDRQQAHQDDRGVALPVQYDLDPRGT